MMRRLAGCSRSPAPSRLAQPPAQAHPHVWITATSELVYAPDGSITGVRHAWTFDDMFSTYALQGIETKTKGVYTREELAPLAQVNVESLKEFDLLHLRQGRRQEGEVLGAGRLLPRIQGRRADAAFHAAAEDAGEGRSSSRSRFSIRPSSSTSSSPTRIRSSWSARPPPASCIPAADDGTAMRSGSTKRFSRTATTPTTARCSPTRSRWTAREADIRSFARAVLHRRSPRSPPLLLVDGALHVAAGAEPVRRPAAGRRRAAGRRHRRLAAGEAVGILPRDVGDHPRRQVRRQRGLDAARRSPLPTGFSMPPAPATARR